jgi:hypothetical protein
MQPSSPEVDWEMRATFSGSRPQNRLFRPERRLPQTFRVGFATMAQAHRTDFFPACCWRSYSLFGQLFTGGRRVALMCESLSRLRRKSRLPMIGDTRYPAARCRLRPALR